MEIINLESLNRQNYTAIGIDFGTTNSVVTAIIDEKVTVLKIYKDSTIAPSLLFFDKEGLAVFTDDYDERTKNLIKIASIKRLLGHNLSSVKKNQDTFSNVLDILVEEDNTLFMNIEGKKYSIVELVSLFLSYIKERSEKVLNQKITKCTIAVPAYFNNKAKGDLIRAASKADLEILRLITEPVAAAYSYKLNNKKQGRYLVYDLGGGTFDTSLIDIKDGVVKAISVIGDDLLGGDDLDRAIANKMQASNNFNVSFDKLLTHARSIKENYSEYQKYIISTQHDKNDCVYTLKQDDFIIAVEPLIMKTIKLCRRLIIENDVDDLDGILVVGGSCKLSLIKKYLSDLLCYPVLDDINPDESVSIGAAYQSNNLLNQSNDLLLDVVPLSIGIELADGLIDKIIPRNSLIPTSGKTTFTTSADNQTGMQFNIVQGEREFAEDCISLGVFELTNLPAKKAGSIKVEATFSLDVNGTLSISSVEQESGVFQDITIYPSKLFDDVSIFNSLEEASNNIEKDHNKKQIRLILSKAQKFFAALKEMQDYQSEDQKKEIEIRIAALKNIIDSENLSKIEKEMQFFEDYITPIMNDCINVKLSENLVGKKID